MKNHWLRLTALGLCVFLLSLVLTLPAGRGLMLAQTNLPIDIHWRAASGSIFNARIDDLLVELPDGRRAVFDRVRVKTERLPLLFGVLRAEFEGQGYGGEITGSGEFSSDTWRLDSIQGSVSLAELALLAPELDLVAVTGRLLFRASGLAGSLRGMPDNGRLTATLAGLNVGVLDSGGPLGDYNLDLDVGYESGIRGTVATVSDQARLHLRGELQVDAARLQFNGLGWAGDSASASLRGMLPLLGQVDGERVRIAWSVPL